MTKIPINMEKVSLPEFVNRKKVIAKFLKECNDLKEGEGLVQRFSTWTNAKTTSVALYYRLRRAGLVGIYRQHITPEQDGQFSLYLYRIEGNEPPL